MIPDVIDFLKADHGRILMELSDIRLMVYLPEGRERARRLFKHFLLHEQIENKIFDELDTLPRSILVDELLRYFKKMHSGLEDLLRLVMDGYESADPVVVERAFNDLDDMIFGHMMAEEEILFPKIREALPEESLVALRRFAEEIFAEEQLFGETRH